MRVEKEVKRLTKQDKESMGIECLIFLNLLVIGAPTLDLIDPYFLDKTVELHLNKNLNYSDNKLLPSGTEVEIFDTSLLKKINLQICMLNKNPFNLHKTYQERRRDGPFDVLATLKSRVLIPTPILEEDERNPKNFSNLFC